MNQATQDFIRQHQDEDVRQLAFSGSKHPEVDLPFALDQIRGRRMARAKLPRWASIEGIVYPPHISMEQCSSEQTALYKAELAARLLQENGDSFIDLTGGFGVDFSYIAGRLGVRSMYVERQAHLCEAAKENFERLGLENAIVRNGDGVETLHSLKRHQSLIFIDPARRDDAGNKVVSLQDCTPDVTLLQDEMLAKADYVVIKLSPMLDWHRAVSELNHVREVHIVSVGNECKELLLVLSARGDESQKSARGDESLKVFCVNDNQRFVFESPCADSVAIAESLVCAGKDEESQGSEACSLYLYEPNASLMKAGCFGAVSGRYGARMLAQNSHLFVSDEKIEGFPGRSFRIKAVSSFNKKELKRQLAGVAQANIATRNFPLSVAELRKRLKLKDGGEVYLFATTLSDESHVLLICEKLASRSC